MISTHKICILNILLAYMTVSCVERYYITEQAELNSKIVVDALITDQDTVQMINLSMTSSLELPDVTPLTDCQVSVTDINDQEFIFNESVELPGCYQCIIDASALYTGNRFRLHFTTPTGAEYISEYEELMPCPPVDSVHYEIMSVPTPDPEIDIDGLQFYIDFKAPEDYGRYYRWQIDETWEYHSTWPITKYWAGRMYNTIDYSLYICYKTIPVDDIFTLSTKGLVENSYKKYKLHFVNDHTQRLMYKYSLLIKQYSLSETAFYYWEALNKNNQESGGLFDSQPAMAKGNISNIRNPGEIVLGYFGVSSVKTKRIILSDIRGLRFKKVPYCKARKLEEGLNTFPPDEWPVYLVIIWDPRTESGVLSVADDDCFDCRLHGGTTVKPIYWDEK